MSGPVLIFAFFARRPRSAQASGSGAALRHFTTRRGLLPPPAAAMPGVAPVEGGAALAGVLGHFPPLTQQGDTPSLLCAERARG